LRSKKKSRYYRRTREDFKEVILTTNKKIGKTLKIIIKNDNSNILNKILEQKSNPGGTIKNILY